MTSPQQPQVERPQTERLRRWRLLLGGPTRSGQSADGIGCELNAQDACEHPRYLRLRASSARSFIQIN